ncbi:MAG: hypothetical protein OEZ34_04035 [Spirochaetia bacterium]|nr:hypothetical protein [Spirochaetia bacterium]
MNCRSGILINQEQLAKVEKEDHGYITFTLPPGVFKRSFFDRYVALYYSSYAMGKLIIWVDGQKYYRLSSAKMAKAQTFKIPIPAGKHEIKIEPYFTSLKPFRGNYFYIVKTSIDQDVKGAVRRSFIDSNAVINIQKDEIISLAIEKSDQKIKVNWFNTIVFFPFALLYPLGYWPYLEKEVNLRISSTMTEKKDTAVRTRKTNLIKSKGTVFSSAEDQITLVGNLRSVRPGSIVYILSGKTTVAKAVISQTFHTQVKGKIIVSYGEVGKGMSWGVY